MKKWFLPVVLLLAMGCRSSDTDPPATERRDAGRPDVTQSLRIWQWPADSGEPRDLAADHAECVARAERETSAMRRTGVLWDCMRRKGWHRVKGAEFGPNSKLLAPKD